MKPTIKDVAKYAGVSTATVSRMLNNSGKVTPETREKIAQAVEALDFKLNTRAQNFKTGKTNAIAVIVPDISNPFFACVINEIESVTSQYDYTLMIANTEETKEREISILQYFSKGSADGIILASTFNNYEELKPYLPSDIPVVFFDRKLDNCPHDTVTESDAETIYQIVTNFVKEGHRKIGCIAGLQMLSTTASRVNAYRNALADAGLTPDNSLIYYAGSMADNGYDAASHFIENDCTALVIVSNSMTRGTLKCIFDHGKLPGKDIAIAGYHNPDFLNIEMTGICMPYKDMGRKSAELMMARLQNPELPVQHIELTSPLFEE